MRSLRLRVLVAGLTAVLVSACAGVPMDGHVHAGREAAARAQEGYLRILPAPPRKGDPPEVIVRGFLQASASFENAHASARAFLTVKANSTWDPDGRVTVYDSGDNLGVVAQPGAAVALTAPLLGSIDAEGRYTSAAPSAVARAAFVLRKVGGEWRIDTLPQGVFLKPYDVVRAFRQVNLYFPSASGPVLVPDPVFVPARPDLATELVRRLLRGPTSWTRPAVRTAFPSGTSLGLGGVQVGEGRAVVDLTAEAYAAGPGDRQALSAQLVWTLSQIRGVARVRVRVEGSALSAGAVTADQSVTSLSAYDPDALPINATAYVERLGRVVEAGDSASFTPLPGPAGDGTRPLRRPAVSPQGDLVAGVSPDGSTLYAGLLGRGKKLTARLTGTSFSAPSWDILGNLWVADRRPGGTVVYLLRTNEGPVKVSAPDLGSGTVTSIRVARDGARIAVAVKRGTATSLLVSRVVVRPGDSTTPRVVRLEEARRLDTDLASVVDVSWANASSLAVLGSTAKSSLQVFLVDTSGWQVTQLGAIPAQSVTAAPGRPVLVGGQDAKVYQASGRQWEVVGPGRDPAYPG